MNGMCLNVGLRPDGDKITLQLAGKAALRFEANGDVFVDERLTTNDVEIVDAFRRWLAAVNAAPTLNAEIARLRDALEDTEGPLAALAEEYSGARSYADALAKVRAALGPQPVTFVEVPMTEPVVMLKRGFAGEAG